MKELRICQLINWNPAGNRTNPVRAQNFFVGETFTYEGARYEFVPFQASGALMTLTGDNEMLTLLFPAETMIVRLVEQGDGNRNATLKLTNLWLNRQEQPLPGAYQEFYIGQGASFSESTVELRFRSTMDAIGARIPYRTLTSENAGILPLEGSLRLR